MSCCLALVQNDTLARLVVTCRDAKTRLPINLAGATVKVTYRIGAAGVWLTRTMVVTNAALGIAEYQFGAGDLDGIGLLFLQVELSGAGTGTSVNEIAIEVKRKYIAA